MTVSSTGEASSNSHHEDAAGGDLQAALTPSPPAAPSIPTDTAVYYRVLFYSYLALALLVFTFVVPPFQKNDEPSHFYRAVSITNLDLFCQKTPRADITPS